MVALHNGGSTGIGKAINGGFGLVLDGSKRVDSIIKSAMLWDVMGGVARRNWAANPNARQVAITYNVQNPNGDQITIPHLANEAKIRLQWITCLTDSDGPGEGTAPNGEKPL
ncbi:hypothetical protein [uncultured Desulfobacter sp.]|nr:hypothetical protein [uncultured Desulfobacter sp.]